MTLRPGTIISMGTPAGVGMGFDPPKWLHPGDVVACSIEASAPSPTPFGNPPSGIRLQRPKISQTESEKERKSNEICNVWFRRSRQRLRFLPA